MQSTLPVQHVGHGADSGGAGSLVPHYRLLDSLQEYVLIDPDTAQVDVFRRNAANRWELYPSIAPDAAVELASVGWQGLVGELLA